MIIPYRIAEDGEPQFAVTKRSDMDVWQFLSGGGENEETPLQAAKREANEEGGIPYDCDMLKLDSTASIPADNFSASREWEDDVYVVPEYSFGADMKSRDLKLSSEHTKVKWAAYEGAARLLTWDSNKTALWELKERITKARP